MATKKDERQIHLDPKEWRDAMRDVGKSPPRRPGKPRQATTRSAGGGRKRSRSP